MTRKKIARPHDDQAQGRHESDCMYAGWAIIKAFMPDPSRIGQLRKSILWEAWRAIHYVATTGLPVGVAREVFFPV